MTLLIDIGNSRLKLGWLDRRTGQREPQPLALAHDASTDAIATWLQALPRQPSAAIGVNVAGQAAARRVQDALGLPVHWVISSAAAAGLRNGYDTPAQLGADRWAALIGLTTHAAGHDAAPLMLASYGTATTIDTLAPVDGPADADHGAMRRFVGGLILPGTDLMRTSLNTGTANLPLASGSAVAFPVTTDQAISSGIAAAQAGALLHQWRTALAHFGQPPVLYVSGGGWRLAQQATEQAMAQAREDLRLPPEPIRFLRHPVLDGLARLAASHADGFDARATIPLH